MPLHVFVEDLINDLRYAKVKPALKDCGRLADLGCRDSYRFLKEVGVNVAKECWGLDLEVPDRKEGKITLMKRDITERLPFEENFLDVVTMLAVVEHIENPRPILRECFRVLRPGGHLILTTPSRVGIYVHDLLIKTALVRDVEPGEHKDFAMSVRVLSEWTKDAGFVVEEAHLFECGMNVYVGARKP